MQDTFQKSPSVQMQFLLCAINYELSAINYELSAINYELSAINYELSAINYKLSAMSLLSALRSFCAKSFCCLLACLFTYSPSIPESRIQRIPEPVTEQVETEHCQ
jgi:hypothetical protein